MSHSIINRITRSLTARLLAVFFITALIYGVAARYTVQFVLDRDYLRDIIGSHVAMHTDYLLRDLSYPPNIERAKEITATRPMDIWISGPDSQWASDQNFPDPALLKFEPSAFLDDIDRATFRGPGGAEMLDRLDFARHSEHSFIRISMGDYDVVLSSPKIATHVGPNLTTPLIGLIAILVLTACFFLVNWLVRPIQLIRDGADRIGQGDLDYRIPVKRRDDLGDLTVHINRLVDDVQGMLEAKQQMLLAISHELRSPLTRTKVALEFLEDDKTRQSIMGDVEEMERLITDLLESERLNTRHSTLQLSSIDLVQLVADVVEQDFANDKDRLNVTIPTTNIPYQADGTRLRLLLKNVIENALCYSEGCNKPVDISLVHDAQGIRIDVADQGSGMSPEEVARATEPFYRADPARCRDTGGFGLGLYLCRRIAEAHGGLLDIVSEPNRGTRVSLILPELAVA